MKTKQCFKCLSDKPLTAFYAHPQMTDGRLGKCKECTKRDVEENRKSKPEYYREYEVSRRDLPHRIKARQKYAASKEGLISGRRAKDAWAERNPEKKRAAVLANNALRDGRLERKTKCEVCGSTKNIEKHHDDYNKPLEVRWLCKKDHRAADEKRRQAA